MTEINPQEKSTRNCFFAKVCTDEQVWCYKYMKLIGSYPMIIKRATLFSPCNKCKEGDFAWENRFYKGWHWDINWS